MCVCVCVCVCVFIKNKRTAKEKQKQKRQEIVKFFYSKYLKEIMSFTNTEKYSFLYIFTSEKHMYNIMF